MREEERVGTELEEMGLESGTLEGLMMLLLLVVVVVVVVVVEGAGDSDAFSRNALSSNIFGDLGAKASRAKEGPRTLLKEL